MITEQKRKKMEKRGKQIETLKEKEFIPSADEFYLNGNDDMVNTMMLIVDNDLSDIDRNLIRLYMQEKCTIAGAARAMGVTPETIRPHIKHAMVEIRRIFEEKYKDE